MNEIDPLNKRKKKKREEITPQIVSSRHVDEVARGYSPKTAANDRSLKRGPKFFMVRGTPWYRVDDLIEYFTRNPVETTDDI